MRLRGLAHFACLLTLPSQAWSTSHAPQGDQFPLDIAATAEQDAPSQPVGDGRGLEGDNNGSTIPVSLFAELEELARIVDISYCVGTLGLGIQKPFACPSRCSQFKNFELITTWNTGVLLSDSCGYIALSHAPGPERIIIAFRGTYSLANTIADLSTMPQEYEPYPGSGDDGGETYAPKCNNCSVHSGFYTSWMNTKDVILPYVDGALEQYPGYAVTLVGHSLGGAVAAFAGLDMLAQGLHPTVTTFGEPRIGNKAMADYLDMRFNLSSSNNTKSEHSKSPTYRRVTHSGDPVPLLPLEEWGYLQHSGEIHIAKADLPPSVADVRYCEGPADPTCLAGSSAAGGHDKKSFWAIPARFRLWELFFAHRDYFWRLGLCVPQLADYWPATVPEQVEL